MKAAIIILFLILGCYQSATAQGLYRTGDSGRNPMRGWRPTKDAELEILSGLKSADPHSQKASDILWDLADFYRNGQMYEQEVQTWKKYISVYDDKRWSNKERLKEQSDGYSYLGRAYASAHHPQAAEEAYEKSVEIAEKSTADLGLLESALFFKCEFYIDSRQRQQALQCYDRFLKVWRRHPSLHPSDLRSELIKLGVSPSEVPEQ